YVFHRGGLMDIPVFRVSQLAVERYGLPFRHKPRFLQHRPQLEALDHFFFDEPGGDPLQHRAVAEQYRSDLLRGGVDDAPDLQVDVASGLGTAGLRAVGEVGREEMADLALAEVDAAQPAHAVHRHHAPRDLVQLLQVAARAGGDVIGAEDHLLGHRAAQRDL